MGWIANGNILGGVVGSVMAGLMLDKILLHRFKESIIALFFIGSCFSMILTLSFSSPITPVPVLYSEPWLIVSLITFIGFLFGCTYPIFYEYGVELTYPVRESSTSSAFVMLVNVWLAWLIYVFSNLVVCIDILLREQLHSCSFNQPSRHVCCDWMYSGVIFCQERISTSENRWQSDCLRHSNGLSKSKLCLIWYNYHAPRLTN